MAILHFSGSFSLRDFVPKTVYGVGRNYSEHARELNNPVPKEPVIFLKSLSTLFEPDTRSGIVLPQDLGRIDHEVEMVWVVGRPIDTMLGDQAFEHYIAGIGVGIDLTARDVQTHAKQNGLPWTGAKSRKHFAPVGNFFTSIGLTDASGNPPVFELTLSVNGTLKQKGTTNDMIFSWRPLLSYLALNYGLDAGDLIFTGTPAGVGSLHTGDAIVAELISKTGGLGARSRIETQVL